VTPRVIFGLAREGLGPAPLAWVNPGGTPWVAMLAVGAVAVVLAATGSFVRLLSIAIALVLLVDGLTIAAMFPLRARRADAAFSVPLYPAVPLLLIAVYIALLIGTALAQPRLMTVALGVLAAAWLISVAAVAPLSGRIAPPAASPRTPPPDSR